MINIGQYATLEVVKKLSFGVYLDGGPFGEILLPIRYVPADLEIGKDLEVFLYTDSEDRIIATTEKPFAVSGELAYLRVVSTQQNGAFLDWGLSKDLFVPMREQAEKMETGRWYVVKLLLDESTDRMMASSQLVKFLKEENEDLTVGQEVELLIYRKTNLGYKVAIDQKYMGLIFASEVFQPLQVGQKVTGFVKNIREDKKIDVLLQKAGYEARVPDAVETLLKKIKDNKGLLPLTDDSTPEEIYRLLQMSKKTFKKAVGSLYKQQMIKLTAEGIKLIEQNTPIKPRLS